MSSKVEISICMGSSCFARGNNLVLDLLEDMIQSRGWQDKVELTGLRCENLCSEGPNIRIDGQLYHGLDEGALLDILSKKLGEGGSISYRMSSIRRKSDSRNA